ncbi:MAG: hypothetical protein ACK57J_09395 [Rubrivivax sp.]
MNQFRRISALTAISSAIYLVGCGGGGGGQEPVSQPPPAPVVAMPSLSGVAAVGAAVGLATITLTDANGLTRKTTSAADGSYRFDDLSGLQAPFQVQASGTLGEASITLNALVPTAPTGAGVANITPLTQAITALVVPTELPTALSATQLKALSPAALAEAGTRLQAVIGPLAGALGLPASFDPLTTRFVADGTGADRLLDHLDVSVTPSGVSLANKMVVATDGQATAAAGATLLKGSSSVPAPLAATEVSDTQGFDELAQRLQGCFAVPASQRLTVSQGVGTLHAACAGIASADYLHNGTGFIHRWAAALNASGQDGATYSRPIVRLRVSSAPERMAVNLNFKDSGGIGYTRPEVIERQADGRWLLVGNRRAFNGYAEAQATHMNDLTPNTAYNNLNGSRVDTGFRLAFDPRASFHSQGGVTYHALDLASSSGFSDQSWAAIRATLAADQRMVGCVIVRGPGEKVGAKWSGFHPNGLLLKRPTGSTAQDYLAIDSVVSDAWRTAIDATAVAANGSVAAPTAGTQTNVCGAGTTASSSSSYVVDAQALGARKHALTGQADDGSIAGRDVAWNTGARFARMAPTGAVKQALEANPPLTFEIFDTDGRLRAVMQSRFLGRLPDVDLARAYVDSQQVPAFDTDSLRRYLDFASGASTVMQTVTGGLDIGWTTPLGAFGADRIGLYAEVYRATPGVGIRGPLSRAWDGTATTSGLWASDPELAASLDAMAGTNFYWWNGSFATAPSGTGCGTAPLVSTSGVNVARSASRVEPTAAYSGSFYGSTALGSACLGTASHALVYREMFFRTYTDQNVRLYVATANRALRAPAP